MNCRKNIIALLASVVVIAGTCGPALAANRFSVRDSAGTTNKFVVTDTGNIGINVTNPVYKFHLVGSGDPSTAALYVYNPGRATGYLASDSGGFNVMRNNDVTVNGGFPRANDRLGYFGFGMVSSGSKYAALIQAYSETDATSTSIPGYMTFSTTQTGSSSVERMRIDSHGNLGVGNVGTATKSLSQKLEVYGGIRVYPVAADASANTTTPTNLTRPTCGVTTRGTIWITPGAITDVLEICVNYNGNYAFKTISLVP